MKNKKKVVIDTNILIDNPEILLDKNIIPILPYTVLAELDNHKRNPDLKRAAQSAIKLIKYGLDNKTLEVVDIPTDLKTPDEKIISAVKDNYSFMTNDIGAQAIAIVKNVDLVDAIKDDTIDYNYTGYKEIQANEEYNKTLHSLKDMQLEEFEHIMSVRLKINEYCIIHITDTKYDIWKNINGKVYRISQKMGPYTSAGINGVQPLDAIQMCALDAVFDPIVPLTVIDGKLGCLVGGSELDVEIEPVFITRKQLNEFLKKELNMDLNHIRPKLKNLIKNNIITVKNNTFDLTEFSPSLLIYFKLNRSQSFAYIHSVNYEKYSFRYWLCYYEFNIEKAYKKYKFINLKDLLNSKI